MSAASSLPLTYHAGDQPVPGYTLVRELGRGAMGVVWLARTDRGFERALKVINLQERGGRKEYRGLRTVKQRKLLHGNLLTLIDYWLKDSDGHFVDDTDELTSGDSFLFLPSAPQVDAGPSTASPLGATLPHQPAATAVSPPSASPPPAQKPMGGTVVESPSGAAGATLVARDTLADQGGSRSVSPPLEGGPAGSPAGPQRRPVQLLVAMELGHQTLDDRAKQCRRDRLPGIPVDELLSYMEQAARGLDYLHREGIVHRDVKPQNIMLVGDVAKVCDYGLVVAADADLRMTSNAFTPLYASPEAVAGKPVTGQSDQYSLAVTYVELRTGRTPYASETAAAVFAAKETGKYDLSRIRSRRVRAVLRRALSPLPNQRYESCAAFVRELQAAERAQSALPWLAAGAALCVGVGLLVAGPLWRPWWERVEVVPTPSPPTPPEDVPPQDQTSEGGPPAPSGGSKDREVADGSRGSPAGRDAPPSGGSSSGAGDSPPPTPPASAVAQVVERARKLRLAGNLQAAATELAAVQDKMASLRAEEAFLAQLALLHLEMAAHGPDLRDVPPTQRQQWQTSLEQWFQEQNRLSLPAQAPERTELAALRLLVRTTPPLAALPPDAEAPVWSTVFRGRAVWPELFSPQEQARLVELRAALAAALVAQVQRWPEAWASQLPHLFTTEELAGLLSQRVARAGASQAAWQAVAADLEEWAPRWNLAADRAAAGRLAEARAALDRLRTQHLVQQLEPLLAADLSQPEVRKELQRLVQPLGEAAPLLARLLALDAELEQGALPRERLQTLREQCQAAIDDLMASDPAATSPWPSQPQWLPLARWLALRLDRRLDQPARPQSVAMLLAWPAPPGDRAPWQNAHRTGLSARWLVELADEALAVTPQDAPRLAQVAIDRAVLDQVQNYLTHAQALGLDAPEASWLGGIAAALRLARQPSSERSDWQTVWRLARAALDEMPPDDPIARRRQPLAAYVAALAAARLRGTGDEAEDRRAIGVLAGLLRQGGWRDEARGSRRADEDWMVNVILPALAIPQPAAAPAELAADLALLWAAQARILERNGPGLLRLEGLAAVPHDEPTTSCLLTAHAAFRRAWELDPQPAYAAGVARTLLKLPRGEWDEAEHLPLLETLVQRHDPETNPEPGLLLAGGWLARKRAYAEPDREVRSRLVAQALRYFERLDQATRDRDSYAIRSTALCNASDTCLRAAFWTPIQRADEAGTPLEGSKYGLLQQALAWSRAAQTDPERDLPEEAFIAEGNALEDLAYYYKLTENYDPACRAFQQAVDAAGRQRSAYALMSLGRCRYRWAVDAALLEGDVSRHHQELRRAHEALAAALALVRPAQWSFRGETLAWRGYLRKEAAEQGPGDPAAAPGQRPDFLNDPLGRLALQLRDPTRKPDAEEEIRQRLALLEQSWQDLTAAAQTVQPHEPSQAAIYLSDALEIGAGLAGRLRDLAAFNIGGLTAGGRDAATVWRQLQADAQALLEYARSDSSPLAASRGRAALKVLAAATAALTPPASAKATASEAIRPWVPLFKSREGDAWQAEYVAVLLLLAEYDETPAAVAAARQVAEQLREPTARHLALGHCLRLEAEFRRRGLADKLRSLNSATPQLSPADDRTLAALEDLYAQALDALAQATDPRTAENLQRLAATPLEQIENGTFESDLSLLERLRLRLAVQATFSPTTPLRQSWYQVLDARMWLHRNDWKLRSEGASLPAEAQATARRVLVCLKPIVFVDKRADLDRPLLRLLEKKLNTP